MTLVSISLILAMLLNGYLLLCVLCVPYSSGVKDHALVDSCDDEVSIAIIHIDLHASLTRVFLCDALNEQDFRFGEFLAYPADHGVSDFER
jgi:hypothetical protein